MGWRSRSSTVSSWRGAYEGWLPNGETLTGVEPGGGVPTAIMSGRQALQILCRDCGRPFVPPQLAAG